MYTKSGGGEKENLLKASKQILCSQEKVLVLIQDSENLCSQEVDSLLFQVSQKNCVYQRILCHIWKLLLLKGVRLLPPKKLDFKEFCFTEQDFFVLDATIHFD